MASTKAAPRSIVAELRAALDTKRDESKAAYAEFDRERQRLIDSDTDLTTGPEVERLNGLHEHYKALSDEEADLADKWEKAVAIEGSGVRKTASGNGGHTLGVKGPAGKASVLEGAGVPLFSPHDLRHRRISLLHLRGVPWARIGEFVGQRNLAVTANTYSHVLARRGRARLRGAARLIGRRGSGGGDGFESGVDPEGTKETADVVSDRLAAQMKLGGDLLRRAALLQKTKHLDLTGGEMRGWRCGPVVGASLDQPEDADHPFTVFERHRADLHGHPRAGGRDQEAGRLSGRGGAEHLLGESTRGRGGFPRVRRRR